MDEEKAVKECKGLAIIFIVLMSILMISNFSNGVPAITFVTSIIAILLLIALYKGANDRQMYGPVCGIIFGVLQFITLSILGMLFGIILIVGCIKLIKAIK